MPLINREQNIQNLLHKRRQRLVSNGMSCLQNNFEPMVLDLNVEENENQEEEPHIVHNSKLDLESYCNSYAGLARIYRLIFIADRCTNLRVEALKMALNYVQSTYNVTLYSKLQRKLAEARGEETTSGNRVLPDVAAGQAATSANLPQMDSKWIEAKTKAAAMKLEKLDADLKTSKLNSIKESVRRGHDDLGDHYLDCGDLSNALKCYSRARDYCTSFRHALNMCFNVIKVSVYLNNWTHVLTYVNKAESTPEVERSRLTGESVPDNDLLSTSLSSTNKNIKLTGVSTRLCCAAGMAYLATKKYKLAAKSFIGAQIDACDFPDLISPSNIAVYGGLCALATFSRDELKKQVISSNTFKLFLEVEPLLRDVICTFYDSRYAACFSHLDELMNFLWLDMYIAPHMNTLYAQIRNKALVQYFNPYMSADLEKMANAFNTSVFSLEDELMKLILEGQIQGRIDSHNKVIYAQSVEERRSTFEKALEMGREHEMKMKSLILRASLIKNHISVRSLSGSTQEGSDQPHISSGNVPESFPHPNRPALPK